MHDNMYTLSAQQIQFSLDWNHCGVNNCDGKNILLKLTISKNALNWDGCLFFQEEVFFESTWLIRCLSYWQHGLHVRFYAMTYTVCCFYTEQHGFNLWQIKEGRISLERYKGSSYIYIYIYRWRMKLFGPYGVYQYQL